MKNVYMFFQMDKFRLKAQIRFIHNKYEKGIIREKEGVYN